MDIEVQYVNQQQEPIEISPDTEMHVDAYSVTLRRWTSRDTVMESLLIKFKVGDPI